MRNPSPTLIELRKRLYDDFAFYAEHALKIRTKKGQIDPFVVNEAQRRLLDIIETQRATEGKVRVVILKARQMGLSTAVGGWLYWWVSQHQAQRALVVTHHSDSTRALFDMTKRFHDHMPALLKPSTRYSSRRELQFDKLDSSYVVATAGGEGIVRGETVTCAHLSEVAFWPKEKAAENFNAITQAIPNTENTAIFIESTANGITGQFRDLWEGAVNGTNGFIPVFLPWFIMPEYREPVVHDFDLTPDEIDLVEAHGLDKEQLKWRRTKIAQSGLDLFKQEYPSTADEAFLTTGRPVFNPEKLALQLRDAQPPIATMALEGREFLHHPRGELSVYVDHDVAESYYIGADVSIGVRGGDWSVAQVLDSQKRQVAVWRGQVHPDYFAEVLDALGRYYNDAFIVVENNGHGLLTCVRLGKDMAYPNFYVQEVLDHEADRETPQLGFRTTVKSKPMIIDELRAAHREDAITLYDKLTLREMQSYVVTESGKTEAEEGKHDDCVMALALANHVHQGAFTPVKVTDDHYIREMI